MISTKAVKPTLQFAYVKLMMDVVGRGLVMASQVDSEVQQEVSKFPIGFILSMNVFPNGPAFIDTKNFFHTDSKKKIIYKIKIDNNLNIKRKKIFKKFSRFDGSPDGMTIDKLKNLWVCHFGGACISVFNKKGKKIHKINLPAKNVTNCTFGGKNNTDLFISTARKSMNKTDLQKFKFSGSLFKVKTNIKGKATQSFKLS